MDQQPPEHRRNHQQCCLNTDCVKRPTYNFPGERHGVTCREHKLPNMVCIR